ncbi:glycosyltransferase [Fictibacillus nanhaiensis]|uniref:glycosyltransferase n=1 Tax=Fictibacillus nanhaiensis TaxID=742169 RepID=UPI002E1B6D4A|nr:glycosyltransferase [Fictibacillus nanhaiensis]
MKRMLIATFDLEIGGVERSLINLLRHLDYEKFQVDLLLYRHSGELLNEIPKEVNLLPEMKEYATFRKSILETASEKLYSILTARLRAKLIAEFKGKWKKSAEPGILQMQLMWKYAISHLPTLAGEYDVAVSYLWPHDFVATKVNATKKIAWVHTDFSQLETDVELDLQIWRKYHHIMAVSVSVKEAFTKKYAELTTKVEVMENVSSPHIIKSLSLETQNNLIENDSRFKLLTVARLSYAKGIDMAVEALKLLHTKGYKNIAWYVVGYGGDEAAIRTLIQNHNLQQHFILLGKQTNPYPYMKSANLYVQPSRYEGKAVTVEEAQILGKPVLITNYSTSKSQVTHGEDGYICDLSIQGLVNGIEEIYHNEHLRKKLIANCEKRDYSKSHLVNKLYQISS